jgi:hypothetical protein
VRDQPIYEFDLFGISGRTRNHPILVNTFVDLHAGLAHAGLFFGKNAPRKNVPMSKQKTRGMRKTWRVEHHPGPLPMSAVIENQRAQQHHPDKAKH